MAYEDVTLTIQAAAVVATTLGVLVALWIAKSDRRAAAVSAQRRWELDLLLRLTFLGERGGSKDEEEGNRIGSEIAAILTALGPERLPLNWATFRKSSLAEAAEFIAKQQDDPSVLWRRCANEVMLELDRTRRLPS